MKAAKKPKKRRVRMTAAMLERRIRAGWKKFKLRPEAGLYYSSHCGTACALGGAIAYRAKSKKELEALAIHSGERACVVAARLLNHKATADDMSALECGFERWPDPKLAGSPFYLLGKKLRAEVDAKAGAK